MHVGTQRGPTTPKMLQYFKRHGVSRPDVVRGTGQALN
jgi:hypothetical protein